MRCTALITGITGQDGSYLAELLLSRGYRVHGYTRRQPNNLGNVAHLEWQLDLHRFPADEQQCWDDLLAKIQPDEVYHLAAESFVPNGWDSPCHNMESNLGLTIHILEAIRRHAPQAKFLNACSREIYGRQISGMVNEKTPMNPLSPYGINKASSRWMVQAYRERYGMFGVNAILFNHESPRRPQSFVTRKITSSVARIVCGLQQHLELGNLAAVRDWGFAGEYVSGLYQMLQIGTPEDFVLGTGRLHSIEDFVRSAFQVVDLDWREYVQVTPELMRATDTPGVAADCTKAQRLLDWNPVCQLEDLIEIMVKADLQMESKQQSRAA
ncbi:MAG: GDP-mannose 4,6-dehydratase [Planctomycetales bacterium]|nr:GDP-mannose 4,6-dehydratase [Planctomycetales bacterium]